jgi:hypothetical protein
MRGYPEDTGQEPLPPKKRGDDENLRSKGNRKVCREVKKFSIRKISLLCFDMHTKDAYHLAKKGQEYYAFLRLSFTAKKVAKKSKTDLTYT